MVDTVVHDSGTDSPSTHVLVIGVGRYPHLLGGPDPTPDPDGMGQLTSPPVSARAFAAWCISELHSPDAPLGTVALLLSEEDSAPFTHPTSGDELAVQEATSEHVAEAIRQWKARGDGGDDDAAHGNQLILYFCGHGTSQGDDMALLLSDFGGDHDNPLNGAIDLRRLNGGLRRCRATRQMFIIDACRTNSDQLIGNSEGFAGRVPLMPGRPQLGWPQRLDVTYYATLSGMKAFARPGEPSVFTQALLRSLKGAASDDSEGDWRVNTARLQESVTHFMREEVFAGEVAGVQVPVAGNLPVFELHRLRSDPVVPVYVGCEHADDNAVATFRCAQDGATVHERPPGDADLNDPELPWVVDLAFGRYDFSVEIDGQPPRTAEVSFDIRPVFRRVKLAT